MKPADWPRYMVPRKLAGQEAPLPFRTHARGGERERGPMESTMAIDDGLEPRKIFGRWGLPALGVVGAAASTVAVRRTAVIGPGRVGTALGMAKLDRAAKRVENARELNGGAIEYHPHHERAVKKEQHHKPDHGYRRDTRQSPVLRQKLVYR